MSTFRQNPRTAGRVIDRVAFVVTPDDNKLHTLNRTGTVIWEFAELPQTLEAIAERVHASFTVTPDEARADAERFVAELVARGILEETP